MKIDAGLAFVDHVVAVSRHKVETDLAKIGKRRDDSISGEAADGGDGRPGDRVTRVLDQVAEERGYNYERPHSSIGRIPPAVYAKRLLTPTDSVTLTSDQ